jgi:hypothetical protein
MGGSDGEKVEKEISIYYNKAKVLVIIKCQKIVP